MDLVNSKENREKLADMIFENITEEELRLLAYKGLLKIYEHNHSVFEHDWLKKFHFDSSDFERSELNNMLSNTEKVYNLLTKGYVKTTQELVYISNTSATAGCLSISEWSN